jgi:hypothetical protein
VGPCDEDVPPRCSTSTLSWGTDILGMSSDQASPWILDHPKFLRTPHWDVSWPTLGPST